MGLPGKLGLLGRNHTIYLLLNIAKKSELILLNLAIKLLVPDFL